jgi:hypothetical protein
MRRTQFNYGEFNPDCMTESELVQWAEFIGRGNRPQVAKQWFPGVRGQYKLARNVRGYCWNKATAMTCRESGNIANALKYEAICDRIYSEFPTQYRW